MSKKIKCDFCNKKLKLHEQIKCKCEKMFCSKHLSCFSHNCLHKIDHKKIIKNNNPKVNVEKVIKI